MKPAIRSDSGFSLMEMLVALAILSISAVLIFQSLLSQSALTARIENLSLNAGRDAIRRAGFTEVVRGIVPSWPEDKETGFIATDRQFSGLSSRALATESQGLTSFRFDLSGSPSELVYSSNGRQVQLGAFSEDATFSYLGADGNWYDKWPPDKIPDFGPFDDSAAYKMPPLPRAVRIQSATRADLDWIASIDWQAPYMLRRQDLNLD